MSDESARKYDKGKAEYSLIPPAALKEIALVFTHGRTKYGPNNWLLEQGLEWTRVYDAAIRHIQAWASGDDTDSESHLPHLAHAAVNIIFLLEYWKRGAGIDNRYFANSMIRHPVTNKVEFIQHLRKELLEKAESIRDEEKK